MKNVSFAMGFVLLSLPIILQQPIQSLSAKVIERKFEKVSENLYAGKYETSNADYKLFIQSLALTDHVSANRYQVDSTKWDATYGEPMMNFYHRHPAYAEYPVVNISYEAAIAYCKWLTDVYNTDPKRKFEKVEFILPSETEWTLAAQGGRLNAMYPWGNYYLRNRKGAYLCNFTPVPDMAVYSDSSGVAKIAPSYKASKGGLTSTSVITTPVKSYFPNNYGLYNMSGNVAEMVDVPGIAMGGSWKSYGSEVTTKSKKTYTGASDDIGFRVFMKVIAD